MIRDESCELESVASKASARHTTLAVVLAAELQSVVAVEVVVSVVVVLSVVVEVVVASFLLQESKSIAGIMAIKLKWIVRIFMFMFLVKGKRLFRLNCA